MESLSRSQEAMNYRRAAPGDWAAIERLLNEGALPLAGARAHLSQFMVCEDDAEIRGCVGAELYGDVALLRSLTVAGSLRGRGAGVALVDQMLGRLRAHDVRQVALLTTTAAPFFAKLGFSEVKRGELPAALQASEELKGACPDSATAMVLRL
jgi:amino-acid N-acetyltransferase